MLVLMKFSTADIGVDEVATLVLLKLMLIKISYPDIGIHEVAIILLIIGSDEVAILTADTGISELVV